MIYQYIVNNTFKGIQRPAPLGYLKKKGCLLQNFLLEIHGPVMEEKLLNIKIC